MPFLCHSFDRLQGDELLNFPGFMVHNILNQVEPYALKDEVTLVCSHLMYNRLQC